MKDILTALTIVAGGLICLAIGVCSVALPVVGVIAGIKFITG